jgi:hypothetical protein
MSEWTAPGNIRKLTASRAFTPGKLIEMSVISTTGAGFSNGAAADDSSIPALFWFGFRCVRHCWVSV